MKSHFASAVGLLVLLAAASARGDDTVVVPSASASDAVSWREQVARLELGYRGVFVTDAGYNPYSERDYFSGVSLALSRTVAAGDRFSFAPGLAWDYGSTSASARAASTFLAVHRLTVPLEGRWRVAARRRSWGYAFVRAAPGFAVVRAEIDDPSAPSLLAKSLWVFALDASAGYALPVLPLPERPGRALRLWLQADAGYSYAADDHLLLAANGANAGSVDLGTLRLRGVFLRVAVAASF